MGKLNVLSIGVDSLDLKVVCDPTAEGEKKFVGEFLAEASLSASFIENEDQFKEVIGGRFSYPPVLLLQMSSLEYWGKYVLEHIGQVKGPIMLLMDCKVASIPDELGHLPVIDMSDFFPGSIFNDMLCPSYRILDLLSKETSVLKIFAPYLSKNDIERHTFLKHLDPEMFQRYVEQVNGKRMKTTLKSMFHPECFADIAGRNKEIFRLRVQGRTYKALSEQFGISSFWIRRILKTLRLREAKLLKAIKKA